MEELSTSLSLKDFTTETCIECGSKFFTTVNVVKSGKNPFDLSAGKVVTLIPIQICHKCGTIPQIYFEDDQLKEILGEDFNQLSNISDGKIEKGRSGIIID